MLTRTGASFGFQEDSHVGSILAAGEDDVLPRLSVWALADALRRLPPDELDLSLRSKLVPIVTLPGLKLFAACGTPALGMAKADGLKVVAYAEAHEFIDAARRAHGPFLLREATFGLASRTPQFSASSRFTARQAAWSVLLLAAMIAAAALLPLHLSWLMASLVAGLFFLSVIALRILCLMPPLEKRARVPQPLSSEALPAYSVLVPLFRETSVLSQLMNALTGLDYPPEKLDIKLILEETDIAMQRAVAELHLPPQFDVIVVPAGKPQTKPRALNYALQFSRGQLLTIFDAEDVPGTRQLRQAAERFASLPGDVACLQAQLTFYNANENWLTRQFTIEYATLFGLILPALAAHHLPLPLGGTSNHFRTGALRKVGAWDPHNVTEDADLGLRLARLGYSTGTLDARTYEEANVKLMNWMRQRARWFKGFLATWLVHMRHPLRFFNEVGPSGFWASQAITLGVFASSLLHPLCMIATLALFVIDFGESRTLEPVAIALSGLNFLIFFAGYAVTMIAGRRAISKLGIFDWAIPIATMPVYWLLMSFAAWLALWQFIVAPFHWNKTEHGLSRLQGPARASGNPGLSPQQPRRHAQQQKN